ncbi:MAG: ABC transporter ATP-binding protein [Alphaproteobacteria bacterium]
MEPTIFRYILRYSLRAQIVLTVMSIASLPFLWWFYDLPKYIINKVIQGDTETFVLPYVDVELDRITYLWLTCAAFLVLVLVNQAFKYVINVYRGVTGERMLRRLRYELYNRILRFPHSVFKKLSQGEIIAMITAEVEPLGGYISESVSLLVFQGGTLLVILGFLLVQNVYMALAAIALYPVQFYLIPKLQMKVNALGKERVRLVRRLSDRIGETVQGVQEVHVHDTSLRESAEFSRQLGTIFLVRFDIYVKKFVIKFLNNTIQQLGPFFFYSIGGYLVITGGLEIGTLVAAIAAHKDLGAPWKELLSYYQRKEDARIKYDQVVAQFAPPGSLDETILTSDPDGFGPVEGEIAVQNVTVLDEQASATIDQLSVQIPLDQRVAIVGPGGGGKEELALLLARLASPDRGALQVGGQDMANLPESITGRQFSYVGSSTFVFNTTLGDNLFYGLKHRPLVPAVYEGDAAKERERFAKEANLSGNVEADVEGDWIDYASADADSPEKLREHALHVLEQVGLAEELYQFGLRGTIDPEDKPEVAEAVMAARARLLERLADPAIAPLVETFDRDKYNDNASVAENLLFGYPVDDSFNPERLAENAYVREVLDKVGLTERFLQAGHQVAATMVELFADLPPDHELFQQFSFIAADDLPDFQALLQRADRNNLAALSADDSARLVSLPFKLIQARHRLGVIDDEMKDSILAARRAFADDLPEEHAGAIAFFDEARYNAAANLQDNILFGKVAYGQAQAVDRVGGLIRDVVEELGLRDTVASVGLEFPVGIAGSRLNGVQRQKLGLARALIKRPRVLVLSEATASLDSASQARIMDALLESFEGRCLIWVLHRPDQAERFDRVLVVKQGRVVEQGSFAELNQEGTELQQILAQQQ